MRDPCEMCEVWMADTPCENQDCPVNKLKAENKRLKKQLEQLRSDASWDQETSTGCYMGRW